jgi:hypothetical protein
VVGDGGASVPRPEYPRPQFRRPDWVNLNGEWRFAFDDEDAGLAQNWYRVGAESLRAGDTTFMTSRQTVKGVFYGSRRRLSRRSEPRWRG